MAENGRQALEALADAELPRFVLLDYMLPDMDGVQVLMALRADPRCRSLPVVMFSSLEDPERKERSMQAGADAWVPKPEAPEALRAAVINLCRIWGQAHGDASAR